MTSFISLNSTAFLKAFLKYGITSPLRIAHFLGQLAVESGNFTANVEKISYEKAQKKYQNHKYLGNKKEGDGYRFRGRGLIQLTGRNNYQRYKDYSGVDVVNHPELASELANSIDIACWYWIYGSSWGNLNKLADKDNVTLVTKGVNGGTTALAERRKATDYFKTQKITLDELKKKVKPLLRVKPTVFSWFNDGFSNVIYKKP